MATVTGLTAARMLEIEAESVVGGTVDDRGHLILTTHDGTQIDAGPVIGPPGPINPAQLVLTGLGNMPVLDVGSPGQVKAGRQLAVADFTTLCGLPSTPVGLFGLSDLVNKGSGAALANKGGVAFGSGIIGTPNQSALFTGDVTKGLYVADTGVNDPFRIRVGSWGCWFRTAKRGTTQILMSKAVSTALGYVMSVNASNGISASVSFDGSAQVGVVSLTDLCDDRWHFAVATFDGTMMALYIDGVREAYAPFTGLIYPSSGPFDLGSQFADATTNASLPHYGRIDEAFVTQDILTEDEARLLYCAKIAHGLPSVPRMANINIHRRRKGRALVAGDFPATPLRLYNLTDLNDLGSNNVPLTANVGTGAIAQIPGPDGSNASARNYSGAHNGDSGTDAGLPSGTAVRTYGCWFKTTTSAVAILMGWGTLGANDARLWVSPQIVSGSGADQMATAGSGQVVNDGFWHFVVVVEDYNALDGLRRKLYLDGKLAATSTTLNAVTLAGAGKFRIGANMDGSGPFAGQIARAFVAASAFTQDQIVALFAKSAQDLGVSPKNPGDHIEAMDATNVYALFDTVDAQNTIDLAVAA